jgi:uncharacterized protein YybS (DUF2232 family)
MFLNVTIKFMLKLLYVSLLTIVLILNYQNKKIFNYILYNTRWRN